MKTAPTILSTKKLSVSQKGLLLNAGLGFVEYDAIKIEFLEADIKTEIQNAIFTSKNAVKVVLNAKCKIQNCFCVGENTKNLLEENGQNVVETAENASDLAEIITKNYRNTSFLFFCGNLRRDELPDILKKNNVNLKEQLVYKTHISIKEFSRFFEGILFFSPSGVQSYISRNSISKDTVAFCIGNTTASEAKKYTDTIIVANKPTVENVIVQAVKHLI